MTPTTEPNLTVLIAHGEGNMKIHICHYDITDYILQQIVVQ